MKALKITLLLLAVVLLAMSGITLDKIDSKENQIQPQQFELNLITHDRSKTELPGNS